MLIHRRPTVGIIAHISARVWRLFFSPYTDLVLLGTLLVISLIAAFVPQSALEGLGATAREAWLSRVPLGLASLAGDLAASGLLDLGRSRFMRVLLALIGSIALLRLLCLWLPSWSSPQGQRTNTHVVLAACDVQVAWDRMAHTLGLVKQRLVRLGEHDGVHYAVVRDVRWGYWLPGLLYLGVLLLLLASVVRERYGWVGSRIDLALGEVRPLQQVSGVAVRLDEITFVPREDETMQRFDSRVSLLRAGEVDATLTLGLTQRGHYAGISLYQVGFGPSVRVSVENDRGEPQFVRRLVGGGAAQKALRIRFSGRQHEQLLTIPGRDVLIRLVHYPTLPAHGIRGRALHVQLLRGDEAHELLVEQLMVENGHVTAEDLTVRVAFEYYAVVRAEREPELPLAAAGAGFLVVGAGSMVAWPRREWWIAFQPRGRETLCHLIVPLGVSQATWFHCARALWGEAIDE